MDERAWSVQAILVARFGDVCNRNNKNKMRTCVPVERDFALGSCSFPLGAHKRIRRNRTEACAKILASRKGDKFGGHLRRIPDCTGFAKKLALFRPCFAMLAKHANGRQTGADFGKISGISLVRLPMFPYPEVSSRLRCCASHSDRACRRASSITLSEPRCDWRLPSPT